MQPLGSEPAPSPPTGAAGATGTTTSTVAASSPPGTALPLSGPNLPPSGSGQALGIVANPGVTLSPSAAPTPPRTPLRAGDSGAQVSWAQERLRAHGYSVAVTGTFDRDTERLVRAFQRDHTLQADGVVGPRTWAALGGRLEERFGAFGRLSDQARYVRTTPATLDTLGVVRVTAHSESGAAGYGAINWDDAGAGISFGRFQFNQKHRSLGALFRRMLDTDRERFVALTFGDTAANANPDALAERLVNDLNGRQPMDGGLAAQLRAPANRAIWRTRFAALAAEPAFQTLQDEIAVSRYLRPARELMCDVGLTSERSLALLFDLEVQHGQAGAPRIVRAALRQNPRLHQAFLQATPEQRPAAEHALLVAICAQSTRYIDPKYLGALVDRRQAILRDPELSDRATLVPESVGS